MKYYDKNATIDWGDLTDVVCGNYEQPTQRPPDFIGIGAQKSATTWLWTQLQQSPSVSMPPVKELHYFDLQLPGGQFPPADASLRLSDSSWVDHARNTLRYIIDLGDKRLTHQLMHYYFSDWNDAWYQEFFGIADPGLITGEITPRYAICDDKAIEHMASVAPEAKLIFCIRNPIDRFWSQCLMRYHNGTLAPGTPAAMALFHSPDGKPRGNYSETLLRFSKWFDPKQLLVVFYDAIARYPQQTLHEIYEFLGLPWNQNQGSCNQLIASSTNVEDPPSELRERVTAGYQHELNCLNDVLGGCTSSWLGATPRSNSHLDNLNQFPCTMQLEESHVASFHSLLRPRRERKRNQFKIFCLSMQRSGTTSTGDWLESHGLVRAGSPTSTRLGWSRSWFDGDLDIIFEDEEFKDAEILEDDPWWFPRIYVQLAKRFPKSRFILLDREPNSWFDSMCRHSGGKNPGWSDIHARIYNREEDLKSIEAGSPVSAKSPNLLPIVHLRKHYTDIYRHHTAEVLKYFSAMPSRLFYGKIDDAKTFPGMLKFLQLKQDSFVGIPHTNKRTAAMETLFQDEVRRLGLS